MGNNPVGKKVNTIKVNTWVNIFFTSRLLKVKYLFTLALGFYQNPVG